MLSVTASSTAAAFCSRQRRKGHDQSAQAQGGVQTAVTTAEARNQHRDMLRRLGAARDTLWIAELGNSMAERNRRAIWGAMNAPGEDAAISRDSLPLASRGFRVEERV